MHDVCHVQVQHRLTDVQGSVQHPTVIQLGKACRVHRGCPIEASAVGVNGGNGVWQQAESLSLECISEAALVAVPKPVQ